MARLRDGNARGKLVVGLVRRDRAGLLRTTALQAVAVLAFAAPVVRAAAQPAPTARPTGGAVVAGAASINQQNPSLTNVQQTSQRAAINWQSYDVGSQHTVQYQQPNAQAIVVNRVMSPDPSQIAGRIVANGQVVISNQSGVVFHQGSQVNAASLVVSAAGVSDQSVRDFAAGGRLVFDQVPRPDAQVTNAGSITVRETGLAALVAPRVANSGTITARLGRAVLAGAETHTVDLYGDKLLSIDVTGMVRQAPRGADGQPVTALVTNTGTVVADGGTVTLTAAAVDGIVQNLVQAGGRIRANTVGNRPGRIEVAGTGGSVVVEGRLGADGREPGSVGGTVVLNATNTVTVAAGAQVTASGNAGGGVIAVGTTATRAQVQGQLGGRPADLFPAGTARQVVVAPGARISADARRNGRGGTVALLSTDATSMGGRITARGGRNGGDGGKVEISGALGLRLTGTADVSAPRGASGTILLDPRNLIISENGPDTDPTVPAPTDANISVTVFNNLSGNVSLSATQDITTTNTTPLGAATQNSVTFTAGRNISIGGPITLTATSAPVTLTAASSDPTGGITIGAGATITVPGLISLNAGTGGIAFLGNVTAQNTGGTQTGLKLTTTGDVTQGSASAVTAGDLYGSAASLRLDSTLNKIGNVGAPTYFDSPNSFVTSSGGFTLVTGAYTAGAPLTIDAHSISYLNGGISVPSGQAISLTADLLTITTGGFGPGGTPVRRLDAPNGTVTIAPLSAGQPLELTPGAKAANTLSLTTAELGVIRAATLNFGSTTAGGMNLADGVVDIGATVGATRLRLLSGGDIRQGSGNTLTANTLTGQAASVVLGNANTVSNLEGFTTTGKFALETVANNAGVGLNVTAPVTGGSVNLSTTNGDIVLSANVTATATSGYVRLDTYNGTSLASSGNVRQNGGVVSADLYSGTARSVDLTTTPGSRIGQVGFNQTDPDLNNIQIGTVGAYGDFRISSTSGIVIGGPLSSQTGTIGLTSGGAITQAAAGTLTAQSLTGTAVSAVLENTGNSVPVLNSFGTTGSFSVTTNGSLTVNGPVTASAGDVTLTSGFTLTLAGNVTGNTVTLNSGGATTQTGGIITAGTLTGSAGSPSGNAGVVSLPLANRIGVLGNYTASVGSSSTPGSFTLFDAQALQVTGTVQTTPAGNNPAIGSVSLSSTGDVTQAAGSAIRTASLTGTAASAAFTSTLNEVRALSGYTTSAGDLSLFTKLTRAVTSTALVPLQLSGTNSVPTGQQITLRADAMTFNTGVALSAPQGTVTLAPLTAGRRVELIGNAATADANSLTIRQSGLDTITTGTLQVGVADTGPINVGNSGDAITLTGHATALRLTSAGAVTEGNGGTATLTVPTIAGTAASATLTNANGIATLADFAVTGAFALNSAQALTVIGPVTAGTQGSISSAAGLTVAGTVTAPDLTLATTGSGAGLLFSSGTVTATTAGGGGTVRLSVAGDVTQTDGVIVTDLLQGTAGSLSLSSTRNQIANVGPFTATVGNFLLTDGRSLAVVGAIDPPDVTMTVAGDLAINSTITGGTVTLSATGAITEGAAGRVFATTLQGSAASATLGQANQVGTLAGFASTNGFLLQSNGTVASNALVVTGPVTDATSVTLGTQGPLTIQGTIRAPSISLTANRAILRNVTSSSSSTLRGTILQGSGTISGATQVSLLADDAISQTGGAIVAGTLAGASGRVTAGLLDGTTTLTSSGNQVGALGGFSSVGGFTLVDGRALQVTGTVQDTTSVALTASGSVSQASGSSVQTGVLRAVSTGGDVGLTSASNQVTLLGASSSAGDFALTDGVALGVGGAVQAGGTGRTLALTADTIQFQPGGSLTATGGTVALAPLSGNPFALGSFVPAGTVTVVTADTLRVGTTASGALTVSGAFNLANVGTLDLRSGSSITEAATGSLRVGRLTGIAASAALVGQNLVGTLGDFSTSGGFSLTNAQGLTVAGSVQDGTAARLSVAGTLAVNGTVAAPGVQLTSTGLMTEGAGALINGSGGPVALRSGDAILLAGVVATPGQLSLDANGHVEQLGGRIAAGTLTGTAVELASLSSATNAVGTLGRFALTGSSFVLVNGQPLIVQGPVVSGVIRIDATGRLVLAGGQLVTRDALLRVLAGTGAGSLAQQGTTSVGSSDGSATALQFVLLGGGTASFNDLQATGANLVLDLGSGRASGNVVVGNLTVLGSGGRADLFGQVAGRTDTSAATISLIDPRIDTAYLFNNCVIATVCGSQPPPPPPPIPPIVEVPVVSELFPKSFQDTLLGSLLRSNQFTADLFTLGILRDPADPNLVLPNISDRDY